MLTQAVALFGAGIASFLAPCLVPLLPAYLADRLAVVIGQTGMNVVLKLSSFLLVCIGVQIFWNGASQLLGSLLR